MGNSGSAHNINIEGVSNELSSYLQIQTQKNRKNYKEVPLRYNQSNGESSIAQHQPYANEWRRSLPNTKEFDVMQAQKDKIVQFKVLPKVTEQLHLRATKNGAILHSGGTISGRKNGTESVQRLQPVSTMQRSRTFITETTKDHFTEKDNSEPNVLQNPQNFSRSQTLLNIKHKSGTFVRIDNPNHSGKTTKYIRRQSNVEQDSSSPIHHDKMELTLMPKRINKYKKRRAPDAPPSEVVKLGSMAKEDNTVVRPEKSTADQTRQTLFANNQKSSNVELFSGTKEVKENRLLAYGQSHGPSGHEFTSKTVINKSPASRIPFRREKSCDAILLRRQIEVSDCKDKEKLKNSQTLDKNDKSHYFQETGKESLKNSKIPQLKKTFYFGMDSNLNSKKVKKLDYEGNETQLFSSPNDMETSKVLTTTYNDEDRYCSLDLAPFISRYDINAGISSSREDINDNGLIIRVRPSLPRRQIDPPSFSPSLAWKMLVEERALLLKMSESADNNQCTDKKLSEMKSSLTVGHQNNNDILNVTNSEAPIQPKKVQRARQVQKTMPVSKTWTPEQDLVDDEDADPKNDDDTSSGEYNSKNCSDGFLFYGNIEKSFPQNLRNSSSVGLFSLSLPRDGYFQMKAENGKSDKFLNFSSLQKNRLNYHTNENSMGLLPRSEVPNLKLESKTVSKTLCQGNNNWVLHKNVSSAEAAAHLDVENPLTLASADPLKSVSTGKHVIYLPGNLGSTPCQTKKTQIRVSEVPRTKKRQRDVRESLQDPIPVLPYNDGKHTFRESSPYLDDSKPFHQRFGFQNTVRLLEKKRLTEKLSKDAEVREAQRKTELEALKRVEEDFQRKRANEKAQIRHQLHLYFGNNQECTNQYQSLPMSTDSTCELNDNNNNIFCRDEPDGCVSSSTRASPEKEGY